MVLQNVICHRAMLLQALIGLFELPEDDTVPEDEHFVDVEDAPGTLILSHFYCIIFILTGLYCQHRARSKMVI